MSVKVIALVTFNEDQSRALAAYLDATGPLLESAGAKIVQQFTVKEVLVGKRPARKIIIAEYPNREAVDMVFQSEAYKNIIPLRDIAFSDYHISVVSGNETENATGNDIVGQTKFPEH
jgi:uncharacterized protein (DUF1330 family)